MKSFFTSQFFIDNRGKLTARYADKLPIVIAGNGLLQRGNDSTYSFFQDANFWYLTGINQPDLILVIDKDESYIIYPERSAARDAFDGKVDTNSMRKYSGVSDVYSDKVGWTKLKKRLAQSKKLTTILPPPEYIDIFGMYTNPARAIVYEQLRHLVPKIYDASPELIKLRTIKQKPEIQAIQRAIDITGETIKDVLSKKRLGGHSYEYEVEASIRAGFRLRGASGEAFDSIVAVGKNAATLHHFSGNDAVNKKDLLLVDIGAEVEHYAADITRVYSLSKPTPRQLEIHAAVKDVQTYAIGLLRPGVLLRTYEAQVVHYLGEQLKALGIIKSTDEKTMRKAYPHRTSHFMGLNVHDSGEYEEPLKAGAVLTVEPGIYLPKESIGVRLEDDILITEYGSKVLSRKIPSDL